MKLPALTTLAASVALASPLAAQVFKTDQGHTEVRFGWSHAGVSMQHGEFTKVDGTLDLNVDDVAASTLNVVIDAASVSSGFGPLDDHLKTADFLLCRRCGVYIGALIETSRGRFGIINTHALTEPPADLAEPLPMHYDNEVVAGRVSRREEKWSPVRDFPK